MELTASLARENDSFVLFFAEVCFAHKIVPTPLNKAGENTKQTFLGDLFKNSFFLFLSWPNLMDLLSESLKNCSHNHLDQITQTCLYEMLHVHSKFATQFIRLYL
jgi:hypothetical protein